MNDSLKHLSSLNQKCAICSKEFGCNAESGNCWCFDYPAILPVQKDQSCICPDCLRSKIADELKANLNQKSLTEKLELADKYSSQGQLIEGIDYTIEQGNYVFSEWFHLKRGSCCGNGCRHCPYPK